MFSKPFQYVGRACSVLVKFSSYLLPILTISPTSFNCVPSEWAESECASLSIIVLVWKRFEFTCIYVIGCS